MVEMNSDKERAEEAADYLCHDNYYDPKTITGWMQMHKLRRIRDFLGDVTDKRHLEVGVGDGFLLEYLFRMNPMELYGCDISEKRLARASERVPGPVLSLQDICSLNYENDFFDTVTCIDVLEHISNPRLAVDELLRVTRTGGRIVISVPNELNNIIGRFILRKHPVIVKDHVNHLTQKMLTELFHIHPAGVRNFPSLPFFCCLNFVGYWIKQDCI